MSILNKFRETTVWPHSAIASSNNSVDETQKKCINQLDKFYQQGIPDDARQVNVLYSQQTSSTSTVGWWL